jgi:hypothetical protein
MTLVPCVLIRGSFIEFSKGKNCAHAIIIIPGNLTPSAKKVRDDRHAVLSGLHVGRQYLLIRVCRYSCCMCANVSNAVFSLTVTKTMLCCVSYCYYIVPESYVP